MKLSLAKVAELIQADGRFDSTTVAQGYSIDSRTLRPGELFFAVRGERLDGHDFVASALERGAVAAVVAAKDAGRFGAKRNLLLVGDTLAALQTLGSAVRRSWGKTVVGVTGSAGKTTTKEAIACVLASRFCVLKSEGNLNNQFGLPLQLLRLQPEHEIAVIEMGMSHAGEIAALAKLAQPNMGVVTLVAPVHLEFFDSVGEVARAKRELIDGLPPDGTAILNADDPYVSKFGQGFTGKIVTFGIDRPADVRAARIEQRPGKMVFEVIAGEQIAHCELPLLGRHNVMNTLAAIAVGLEQAITLPQAAGTLAQLHPADKRGELLSLGGATVLNDCYNSNPKALDAMVDVLASIPAKRRIVVAGEMLELGPAGAELHRASGRHIAERGIDLLLGVRGLAREIVQAARASGTRAEFVATPEDAGEWLARNAGEGDAILLKASRGVKLERALEAWKTAGATK